MLHRNEVDLAIGGITFTAQRAYVTDFALSYLEENLGEFSKILSKCFPLVASVHGYS